MVIHDSHIATHTDKMLFLHDGRLLKKEKKGTHLIKKKLICPRWVAKFNQMTYGVPIAEKIKKIMNTQGGL